MPEPVKHLDTAEKKDKISNCLRLFLKHILNIAYPRICLSCRVPLRGDSIDGLLCHNCWAGIKKNNPPLCAICGRQMQAAEISSKVCFSCRRKNYSFDRALSPCKYEGIIRELIHQYKYQNKDHLALPLSRLLIDFIKQYRINLRLYDLVIPVPLHRTKLREREFNQAELLAQRLAKEFSLAFSSSNLWRKYHRHAQMELSEDKRWENINGCFALHNPAEIKGKNIILIDDVLTSGATCSEAAAVMKSAGAVTVLAITIAN